MLFEAHGGMSGPTPPAPRSIDHVVLPTARLAAARARLTGLGFTVAPEGRHPFGTKNACVYLADGTFLEPLAQLDDRAEREASRQGNIFAARDLSFRYRQGEEGFSALVFGTDTAAADHADFVESGFSGGPVLDFSRDFTDASGKTDRASFRLAFAADWRAPDCFFFTCQRVNVPGVDRSTLQVHENGVTCIKGVVLSAPGGRDYADFLLVASNAAFADERRDTARIVAANAVLELVDSQVMNHRFGAPSPTDAGLRLRVIRFGVRSMDKTEALLRHNEIAYERRDGAFVVHPAPGQGAIFAFEAA
jgi:hypothetical protein